MKSLASIMKLSHRKFIAVAMATGIAASGSLVWSASNAAFTATTNNDNNSWTTGAVTITDDDTGGNTAMFTAAENALLVPGAEGYQCIKVTYNGTINAGVRLVASAHTTSALESKVNLTVEMNDQTAAATDTGAFANAQTGCIDGTTTARFTPDTDGTIYNGNLADFWTKYNTGSGTQLATAPTDVGGLWTPTGVGQSRVYRFHWSLDAAVDGANLQGLTCTFNFQWVATQA